MLDFRSCITCKSGSIWPTAAPTESAETVGRVAHVAAVMSNFERLTYDLVIHTEPMIYYARRLILVIIFGE